jgi:beta-lactamase class A
MHAMKYIFSCFITFILGAVAGISYIHYNPRNNLILPVREIRQIGDYHFINPLLECEISDGLLDSPKENFKLKLFEKVKQLETQRNQDIAVYYRDLNNGPAFGTQETEKFIPASLLKVPVMMAFYHEAESNPAVLSQYLLLDKAANIENASQQYIAPRHKLVMGQSYTVNELIDQAIIYSDNDAISLLIDHVSEADLRSLYNLLGVSQTAITIPEGRLSVREYASFFRILFNASYLSRDYSEKALELLSRIDFKDGLVAGVPPNVVVSHKFGEGGTQDSHQIHDCGIIYAKNHPYLLCVMTRGPDIGALIASIADISRFVYGTVTSK